MKTLFKTKRWTVYIIKSGSYSNGNGWTNYSLVFRKKVGTGDDGVRSLSSFL